MVDTEYGEKVLICDMCGDGPAERFEDIEAVIRYRERNGWEHKKEDDEWIDICPDCK